MNWGAISEKVDGLRDRGTDLQKRLRSTRRRIALLLAVVGPGIITSNVDNDAGGISVYTQSGAQYGYALLWSLIPMTIALYVMITGFFVDLANVVAEFAGVAAAMQIFHVSRYISVPIAAVLVWVLVLRGTYRQVEVVFLAACVLYLSYVLSAIFAT